VKFLTESFKLAGLVLVGVLLFLGLVLVTPGCSTGDNPTRPDVAISTPAPPPAPVAAPPAVTPTPAPTAPGAKSWSGYIKDNAGWFVKNETDVPSVFYAYYTSFDNQELALAVKTFTAQRGDYWEDTFDRKCVQVDLTYAHTIVGGKGGHPFLFGFINHEGNPVHHSQIDWTKCGPTTCTPTFTTREVVTYEGQCEQRVRVTTTYTLNSCTKQETASVERAADPDKECEPGCDTNAPVTPTGVAVWDPAIIQDTCNPEVLPLPFNITPADATAPACHQNGTQPTIQCTTTGILKLCKNVACSTQCIPTWIEQQPEVTYSAWSTCVNGDQTRTKQTVVYEVNSCTSDLRVKSDTTITEHQECQTPGLCYYKVKGSGGETEHEAQCEATKGGDPEAFGVWFNFEGSKLNNHCTYTVPGLSDKDFNLTPGQSDSRCLDKKP
jgi:hypothetical protein